MNRSLRQKLWINISCAKSEVNGLNQGLLLQNSISCKYLFVQWNRQDKQGTKIGIHCSWSMAPFPPPLLALYMHATCRSLHANTTAWLERAGRTVIIIANDYVWTNKSSKNWSYVIYTCTNLFHCPMQGPQAFANTVPPNSLKVSAWPRIIHEYHVNN